MLVVLGETDKIHNDVIAVVTVYFKMVGGVWPPEKEQRCHQKLIGVVVTNVVVVAKGGMVRVAGLVVKLSGKGEAVVVVGIVVAIRDVVL